MDGWIDEEAEMCRGGRMEGRWEQLVVPGPPTPCADSREGKARGRHWTSVLPLHALPGPRRETRGTEKRRRLRAVPPARHRRHGRWGRGGKMAPPAPGRSRFRHSGRPADGGGGGGASQGAGRSRGEAGLPPLPPAPAPAAAAVRLGPPRPAARPGLVLVRVYISKAPARKMMPGPLQWCPATGREEVAKKWNTSFT